jgi:hypothetical protein
MRAQLRAQRLVDLMPVHLSGSAAALLRRAARGDRVVPGESRGHSQPWRASLSALPVAGPRGKSRSEHVATAGAQSATRFAPQQTPPWERDGRKRQLGTPRERATLTLVARNM